MTLLPDFAEDWMAYTKLHGKFALSTRLFPANGRPVLVKQHDETTATLLDIETLDEETIPAGELVDCPFFWPEETAVLFAHSRGDVTQLPDYSRLLQGIRRAECFCLYGTALPFHQAA